MEKAKKVIDPFQNALGSGGNDAKDVEEGAGNEEETPKTPEEIEAEKYPYGNPDELKWYQNRKIAYPDDNIPFTLFKNSGQSWLALLLKFAEQVGTLIGLIMVIPAIATDCVDDTVHQVAICCIVFSIFALMFAIMTNIKPFLFMFARRDNGTPYEIGKGEQYFILTLMVLLFGLTIWSAVIVFPNLKTAFTGGLIQTIIGLIFFVFLLPLLLVYHIHKHGWAEGVELSTNMVKSKRMLKEKKEAAKKEKEAKEELVESKTSEES